MIQDLPSILSGIQKGQEERARGLADDLRVLQEINERRQLESLDRVIAALEYSLSVTHRDIGRVHMEVIANEKEKEVIGAFVAKPRAIRQTPKEGDIGMHKEYGTFMASESVLDVPRHGEQQT